MMRLTFFISKSEKFQVETKSLRFLVRSFSCKRRLRIFYIGGESMEEEKRLHRCCFTGHRPEKMTVLENLRVKALIRHNRLKAHGVRTMQKNDADNRFQRTSASLFVCFLFGGCFCFFKFSNDFFVRLV